MSVLRWSIARQRWVTARRARRSECWPPAGLLTSAELEFVAADDVPNGGVLCALPALLAEKLLSHTRTLYRLPPGFYPLESIFLALALYRRFVEFCEACAPATSILAARATSRAA